MIYTKTPLIKMAAPILQSGAGSGITGQINMATGKNKQPERIHAGDLYDPVRISDIRQMLKSKGLKLKDAYLETELDYAGCYYEGDIPSIKIKVYGVK